MTRNPTMNSRKAIWSFILLFGMLVATTAESGCSSEPAEKDNLDDGTRTYSHKTSRTVEGDSFSLTLTNLNDGRHQVEQLTAWTAFSEDGQFGEGPTGPCPISWVGKWITCKKTVSFEMDILLSTGQLVEKLVMENCAAGTYSFELNPADDSVDEEATYTIRTLYQGEPFQDHRIRVLESN